MSNSEQLTTARVFLAVLFLGLFALAIRNVSDPDVWWHLRTGQYIAEHKSVPRTDPFSYTRGGQPWVAHEWLTELMLYEVERTAGFGGLIVIFAATISAAFFFFYLRGGANPYVAGLVAFCAAWATAPIWGVRPQVLSLLLMSLWLLILERAERNPRILWWTIPLTLVWVNLHGGFAVGLVLLFFFLAGRWIEQVLSWPTLPTTSELRNGALILLLNLLVVPLNPNGLRLFSYPLETLRSIAMKNYIAEWASPNFHRPEYWPFLLLVLATFATLICSRYPLRPRDLLLLLVTLYAGLGSIRLMPLFIFIAGPLIARRLQVSIGRNSQPRRRGTATARASLNGVIVVAMVAFVAVHTAQVIRLQPGAEMQSFPAGAVNYLRAHPPAGPLFNHYDWGGYLIWRLYPSIRVFVDGRADLYQQPLLEQFADTYQFKRGWQKDLEQWGIGTVLVPRASALATGLRSAPGWSVSYEDSQAVVLRAYPGRNIAKSAIGSGTGPVDHVQEPTQPHDWYARNYHRFGHFAGYYE